MAPKVTKPKTLGSLVTNLVIPVGTVFLPTLEWFDRKAATAGLSRAEYVRREMARMAGTKYPGVR